MKCICGYEHIELYDVQGRQDVEPSFKNGDKPFFTLDGDVYFRDENTGVFSKGNIHTVYACPECGTLKIDL